MMRTEFVNEIISVLVVLVFPSLSEVRMDKTGGTYFLENNWPEKYGELNF